jgi:hypothetical protein
MVDDVHFTDWPCIDQGGDNSHRSIGTFYEGVMVAGYTSDEIDNAVQANVAAVYASADSLGRPVVNALQL